MKLPLDFVRERVSLSWREVEFGLQNGWLDGDDAVGLAMDEVAKDANPSSDVLELASVLPHERGMVPRLVEQLARTSQSFSNEKWLYLLLAWLYCNRTTVPDAFRVVEEIYATFDYPDEIAPFVRYMPAPDPTRAGETYMLEAWRNYLDRKHALFGQSASRVQC